MVLLHELPCPPTAKHYLGPLKPLPEYLQRALKTWFDSSAREVCSAEYKYIHLTLNRVRLEFGKNHGLTTTSKVKIKRYLLGSGHSARQKIATFKIITHFIF